MGFKSAEVRIKGVSALLMHRFPLEPIEAIEKKTKEEQAEIAAYRTDGPGSELYVHGVALQRTLINAAVYSKGKGRASLQKSAAACLMVTPEHLGLGVMEYKIDARAVVNPSTKGRVVRVRPRIDTWELGFTLEWDDTLLTEDQVRRIVDDAGQRVGLLDFRPACKGPFGRFMVTEWKTG